MDFEDINGVVLQIVLMMVPFLLSLTIHEAAHAWTANKLGDPTAKLLGRISLNPMAHADPIGTILFPIFGAISGLMFGWAKPVPVNPLNLKNYRSDIFWISLAGPLSNFILAFIFTLILATMSKFRLHIPSEIYIPVAKMTMMGISINLALCFFNLIPLGPLDGAKILSRFLPNSVADSLERFSMHGMIILLILMGGGLLGGLLSPPINYSASLFIGIATFLIN